jgi:dTDP-glucose 4,6-dehydratase
MTEDLALPAVSRHLTGCFKRAGENILWMFASEFGLDLRIIRPPRIYGPYYRTYRNPVRRMLEATAAGQSINLPEVLGNSGGDFIYVEDLARAIGLVHLAEKTTHKIYNAGGGTFTSYREIANVMERLRPGIRITLGDQDDGDVSRRWVDITRISEEFGYSPSYGIEEGHRAWLDWYSRDAT